MAIVEPNISTLPALLSLRSVHSKKYGNKYQKTTTMYIISGLPHLSSVLHLIISIYLDLSLYIIQH